MFKIVANTLMLRALNHTYTYITRISIFKGIQIWKNVFGWYNDALSGKMFLVRIVENNKIDDFFGELA